MIKTYIYISHSASSSLSLSSLELSTSHSSSPSMQSLHAVTSFSSIILFYDCYLHIFKFIPMIGTMLLASGSSPHPLCHPALHQLHLKRLLYLLSPSSSFRCFDPPIFLVGLIKLFSVVLLRPGLHQSWRTFPPSPETLHGTSLVSLHLL